MSFDNTRPTPGSGGYLGDLLDASPDVDRRSCRLLGPTALIVQGLMGVLVILSLVYKRHREKPMRPWRIWLFDVSKQIVGQMFVHGANVLVSDLVGHHTSGNACVFYFLNILIDTTLGVGLIYLFLRLSTYALTVKLHLKGFESGEYGNPPSVNYWLRQAAIYVAALTTMKFLVLGLLVLFPGIFKLGEWLLSWTWTGDGDSLQVVFTMGLFPIIMNILQFWLIDSIVKASDGISLTLDLDSPDSFDSGDREPLFDGASDDEDDTGIHHQHHDIENPRTVSRSRSPPSRTHSFDKAPTGTNTPYEPKSSGSNTPGQTIAMHAYPPSLSSSVTSTASTPSTSSSTASLSPKLAHKLSFKRRSPPKPLALRVSHQPAINSPQKSSAIDQPQSLPTVLSHTPDPIIIADSSNEWTDNWDDDDWANRVAEEEWTGRRIEQKKDILQGVWDSSPTVRVG